MIGVRPNALRPLPHRHAHRHLDTRMTTSGALLDTGRRIAACLLLAGLFLSRCATAACPPGEAEGSVFCKGALPDERPQRPPPDPDPPFDGGDDDANDDDNSDNDDQDNDDQDNDDDDLGDGDDDTVGSERCTFPSAGWGDASASRSELDWQARYWVYRNTASTDELLVQVQGRHRNGRTEGWGAYRLRQIRGGLWRYSTSLNSGNRCVDESPPSLAVAYTGNGVYELAHTNSFLGRPVTIHPRVIRARCVRPDNLLATSLSRVNRCN